MKTIFIFLILISTSFVQATEGKTSITYTFDQALNKIIERSTAIHVQETKVNASDWEVFASKGNFLPHLAASASQSNDDSGSPAVQTIGLTARLNLFRGGADIAALHAAQHNLISETESLKNVGLTSEQEAVQALASAIEETQNVDILNHNVEIFKTDLTIAHQRFARGILPRQELDVVTIDLSNAEARLKNGQSRQAQARASLERLLGPGDVEAKWPWKDYLNRVRDQLVKVEIFNPENRPDVRAAQQMVASQEARMKMEFRNSLPALDLTYGPSVSQYPSGNGRANTTYIGLSLPFFDGFRNYSTYKVQFENYAAADLNYRQLLLDAESQWHASRERFSIALDTALERDKTQSISQRVYDANQERFRQGRASANDIAVDHGRLVESELLDIQGWSSAHLEFASLCHALGRNVGNCLK